MLKENKQAKQAYINSYRKEHYKQYNVSLSVAKDADIIEWLKGRNINSIIRNAYREEMKESGVWDEILERKYLENEL